MKMISLSIFDYAVEKEPDYKTISKLIDDEFKKHFMGKKILLRGIGSK